MHILGVGQGLVTIQEKKKTRKAKAMKNEKITELGEQVAPMKYGPGTAVNGIHGDGMVVKVKFAESAVLIRGRCVITNNAHQVEVGLDGWMKMKLYPHLSLKECWPEATADEIEWLMSGISPEGWDTVFAKDEDEQPVSD